MTENPGRAGLIVGADHSLEARFHSIRKLGTRIELAEPSNALFRQLFHEVLGLDESASILKWMAQRRPDAAAQVALILSLDLARNIAESKISISAGQSATERAYKKRHTQYGDLFQSEKHWFDSSHPFWNSLEPGSNAAEYKRITSVITSMRQQSHLPTEISPSRSSLDPGLDTLLADLLRLPDSIDPLQWLIGHRQCLTARLALAHMVTSAVPMKHIVDSAARGAGVLRSIHPTMRLQSHGCLRVSIRQIDVMEDGFAVKIEARFRIPTGWRSIKDTVARWEGFSSVSDSEGGQYVVQMASVDICQRPWWWTEYLTLACWPAIGVADKLICDARPAYLSVYRFPTAGSTLVPTPGPILGGVSCTARLRESESG